MIIGLEIWADYGHFSHPATIYSSLTYPIPPKTTFMGMLGAIAGIDDYLPLNDIKYSVIVENLEGKREFCFNGIKEILSQLNPQKSSGFKKGRKQFYRELLINPKYRIYCDLGDVDSKTQDRLIYALKNNYSLYPLYMGINFCLADYRFLGTFTQTTSYQNKSYIDSMIPLSYNFEIEPNKQYTDIRIACSVKNGRIFGNFTDCLVELSSQSILCRDCNISTIDNRNIVWI